MPTYAIGFDALRESVRRALDGAISAIVKEETDKANEAVTKRIVQAAADLSVKVSQAQRIASDKPELIIVVTGKD
jgi:hypothetical protein